MVKSPDEIWVIRAVGYAREKTTIYDLQAIKRHLEVPHILESAAKMYGCSADEFRTLFYDIISANKDRRVRYSQSLHLSTKQ